MHNNYTSCSLFTDNYSESNIMAKIRRLKIQEDLITQNINKYNTKIRNTEYANMRHKTNCEYKDFISRLQNSYTEIKNLFESVKTIAHSRETLQSVGIDDVKNDVFGLETKIKEFKLYLHSKLNSLKSNEQHLIKDIHTIAHQSAKTKTLKKLNNKSYNDIIPSPVKTIINSPFKCIEVQEFQNFIAAYRRYGGWNEYNHNIFVRLWKKYFDTEKYLDSTYQYSSSENFPNIVGDLVEKIPGTTKDEIIAHIEWYIKYLYLKDRQQKALDKWKTNKKKINKCHRILQNQKTIGQEELAKASTKRICGNRLEKYQNVKRTNSEDEKPTENTISSDIFEDECEMSLLNLFDEKQIFSDLLTDVDNNKTSKDCTNIRKNDKLLHRLSKPTKQWRERCNTKLDTSTAYHQINSIDNTGKLGVPKWRLSFREE
ncbi:uncharacterized protein LOC113521841 [Galleria mellonella]|uniref:Uncharacterized protein LOC113521841 n=1 Tax=Galleria mellonella TaxID=7137 RepID=A0A6J3BWT1_GALME|nr:uncharacterized protein LOC113521841 [Galleria mellonella]